MEGRQRDNDNDFDVERVQAGCEELRTGRLQRNRSLNSILLNNEREARIGTFDSQPFFE